MPIILFDGVCNLCNQSVQFIIKRDPNGYFKFASLQSQTGQQLLNRFGLDNNLKTIVLIENEKIYMKSTAVLRIVGRLRGFWPILGVFRIIPPFLRDIVYQIVAKNRYRWFGKQDSCMLPFPGVKNRFLE